MRSLYASTCVIICCMYWTMAVFADDQTDIVPFAAKASAQSNSKLEKKVELLQRAIKLKVSYLKELGVNTTIAAIGNCNDVTSNACLARLINKLNSEVGRLDTLINKYEK